MHNWIQEERQIYHRRVRAADVKRKALQLHDESESAEIFIASRGWFLKFCNRFDLTLRRRTTISQRVPADAVPRLVSYCMFIRKMRIKTSYQPNEIIAADETSIALDMPGNTSIDSVGTSDVPIKTTGHERSHITVMLAAKGDGKKLPVYLVLKRAKKCPELESQFRGRVVIGYNKKTSWFDQEVTEDFIKKVLGQALFGGRRLLAWDSFR